MAIEVIFDGSAYQVPERGDTDWNDDLTSLIQSFAENCATLTGSATLTNKTLASPTLTGTIAGSPNFSGSPTVGSAPIATTTGTQTLTNKTINGAALSGTLSGSPNFSGSPTVGSVAIATAANSAPAILVFGYTTGTATAATQYVPYGGPYTTLSTGSSNRFVPVPFTGVIRNIYVSGHGVDTTSSANAVFEILRNDVATGVTVTMTALTRTGSNTSSTLAVTAGDRIGVKLNMASATAPMANCVLSMEVDRA